jgi:hypothetical protein
MNRYNIIKGFLSGADLDLVQQWDSMAPDRFISSPWVMKAGDPAPAVLRKAYEAGRFEGLSALVRTFGVCPRHNKVASSRWHLAVRLHTARPADMSGRGTTRSPACLQGLANRVVIGPIRSIEPEANRT